MKKLDSSVRDKLLDGVGEARHKLVKTLMLVPREELPCDFNEMQAEMALLLRSADSKLVKALRLLQQL